MIIHETYSHEGDWSNVNLILRLNFFKGLLVVRKFQTTKMVIWSWLYLFHRNREILNKKIDLSVIRLIILLYIRSNKVVENYIFLVLCFTQYWSFMYLLIWVSEVPCDHNPFNLVIFFNETVKLNGTCNTCLPKGQNDYSSLKSIIDFYMGFNKL